MEKLLTTQQVADGLGMHYKTLLKLLRADKIALNFIRVQNRRIAFRQSDVEKFLNDREVIRTGSGSKPAKTKKPTKPAVFWTDRNAEALFAHLKDSKGNYRLATNAEAKALFAGCKTKDGAYISNPTKD